MVPAQRAWDRRLVPLLLLVAMAWLLAHPWTGLWHDGRLYAVQALRRLHPENFQHDLYFLYGSQDAFTLFSPLFAACIAAFGVQGAGLLLYLAGSALWLAASAFLLSAFLRGLPFWLAMLCVVLLPTDYGPVAGIFTLGEPYPTPRIFAEALGMLALAVMVRGRWRWGLLPLALGFLLHPLMSAGAALVGLLYLSAGRWRAVGLAVAGAAALLAAGAAAGISPFDRILLTMDGEWLALVAKMAPMVTWEGWHAERWLSRTAVAFSLVLAAACLARGRAARLLACLAAAGAIGLLASWAGTGLVHNLLLIQAQPWRVWWLLQWGAWAALAWLLASYWPRGGVVRLLLLVLVVATLTRNSIGGALAVLAAPALCWQVRRPVPLQLAPGTQRMLTVLVLAIGTVWLAEVLKEATDSGALAPQAIEDTAARIWGWTLLRSGALAVAGAGMLLWLWRWLADPRPGRYLLACLAALAGLALALLWRIAPPDFAHPMSEQARHAVQAAFQPLVPATAAMYWENDVRGSWFLMQRSSYVSSVQLAGAAFNRGTALEGARRLARLQHLGVPDAVREHEVREAKRRIAALPQPSLSALQYVCADPALDFVVLTRWFGQGIIARVNDAASGRSYFLYDCSRLRAGR
jgi:hypothetical protein